MHILQILSHWNEGQKDCDDSIAKAHNAMRYVRSSPSRVEKFKRAKKEKIESKSLACHDVPTRSNSTYLLSEAAEKF